MKWFEGYVYFVRPVGQLGPVKIGHSMRPEHRLAHLMSWSPSPLEIAAQVEGPRSLESNLHDCFFDLHSHREWFHESPRITDLIEKLQAGVPVTEAIDLSDIRGCMRSDVARRSWEKRRAAA